MRLFCKLYLAAGMLCCFVFTGCFEVEEKTAFTTATTGNYAITVDMSEMIARLKMFGAGEQLRELPLQDTTILFRDALTTDSVLTAQEKQTIIAGTLKLQMNREENVMKLTLANPFKDLKQLNQSRDVLFKMLTNTGKGSLPAMEGLAQTSAGVMNLLDLKALGIVQKADKGLLTQTISNPTRLKTTFENDSSLQQLKQMTALLGAPVVFKNAFTFPAAITSFQAVNGTLSADKKSLLIRNTLEDLLDNPALFTYQVRY